MFGDLNSMWEFISQAPYFITIAFAGSLLLTFTVVKLSQSEALYHWVSARIDVWRAKQARKIRQSMTADISGLKLYRFQLVAPQAKLVPKIAFRGDNTD